MIAAFEILYLTNESASNLSHTTAVGKPWVDIYVWLDFSYQQKAAKLGAKLVYRKS